MNYLRKAYLALIVISGAIAARAQTPTTFLVGSTTVTATEVATNLNIVWQLAWGPDNFLWMTERYGRISRVNPATGQVLPLLTLPEVREYGEGGLLGMALHPQFATSPYVYVVYNYNNATGQFREKLVRFTYSATANSLTNPVELLTEIPAEIYHNGSRLVILSDLTMLMTTGDANLSYDAQTTGAFSGKVLRLNLDGTIPASNPFANSYVFTLGHRNPQGLVQLPSGRIYSSEHGPANDDEINLLEVGRNYGWPDVEGFCNLPAEAAYCSQHNIREPLVAWTPTIAPAGLAYYDHPAIPGWRGSLLLATLKNQRLMQLALNAAGDGITSQTEFLQGAFGRLRAICVSPQGKVYISTSNRGSMPAPNDDKIVVLENRAYLATANPKKPVEFSLWPNPTQRQATLQLPAAGMRITVRDLLGRVVQEQRPAATTATLDLAILHPGSYLVQAEGPAGTATRKLVVE
jgi:glucose/arabinose dehydrogenase